MFQEFVVGITVCFLAAALVLAVSAPYLVRAEYHWVRGHWPQAIWVARLYLAGLEGVSLFLVAASIPLLLTILGNPPLLSPTGAQPAWALIPVYSILGLTVLACISMVGLMVAQWHHYGLPPRNPPT